MATSCVVNSAQFRLTWEENLSEELSGLCWPWACLGGILLVGLTEVTRATQNVGSTISLHEQIRETAECCQTCIRVRPSLAPSVFHCGCDSSE